MNNSTDSPEAPVGGAVNHMVSTLVLEDQGAACLRADVGREFEQRPALLVQCIISAVDRGLHVPKDTAALLADAAPLLRRVAPHERAELLAALVLSSGPADAVDLAVRTGVLQQLLPDVDRLRAMPKGDGRYKDVYVHTLRVLAATPADLITRLAALLHDVAKPDTLVIEGDGARFPNHDLLGAERAERRLRGLGFDRSVADAVATLVRLHLRANSYERDWTDSAVRRLRLDAGDQWQRLLDLSFADVTSARPEVVARARRRVQELNQHAQDLDKPVQSAPVGGTDLMERFGRGPGRWIGDAKHRLLDLVHAGLLDPEDREAAFAVVGEMLREQADSSSPRANDGHRHCGP
jgi:poly(A) polymerase